MEPEKVGLEFDGATGGASLPWLRSATAARRAVVAGAFLSLCVTPMAVMGQTTGLFVGPVTHAFGWTRGVFVLGPSIAGAICGLGFPFLGLLGDRVGLRPVLLIGIVAYGLSVMSLALQGGSVPVYFALCTATFVTGLAQTSVLYAKAISEWFADRRGLMLSIGISGTGVGSILMPIFASHLIQSVGWRGAYIGLGGVVIAVAAPTVFFLVQEPARRRSPAAAEANPIVAGLSLREAIRTRAYWLLMFLFLASNAGLWGLVTNLAPILTSHGIALPQAAMAMAALGVSQTLARLLSGFVLDRTSTPRVATVWYALATAGAVLLSFAHKPSTGLVVGLLVGAAWGAENELAAYFTSRYFGFRAYGLILGTFFAAFSLGGMPLAYVIAHSYDVHGNYDLAAPVLAGCLILSCMLGLLLGPYEFSKSGVRRAAACAPPHTSGPGRREA